ncbi:hypothetical protein PoB_002156600 [Plakobranchus ocellatus]|uniref:Sulfatase N-terminal domain-containing protein n=1 Tax=Plakobranchus ocellatus TaxID=259542 RepID=A0AAV3Z6W3_9GAST|nr:hypothetical protein PoB_002156600 [Plakobranchus ocellatus]
MASPKCTHDEWLHIENGTVRLSTWAQLKYGNFTCDYYPLIPIGDNDFKFGNPIRNFSDEFKMVSDFFKGVCKNTKNVINTSLYSGIHHNVERAHRSDKADPLSFGFKGMNIAILGFDSMSRMSWHRRLKQTRSYFKDTLGAIELESHNIVGDGTTAVMFPMLTGKFEWELPECRKNHRGASTLDKFPFLWHNMKRAGYLTSWCNGEPRSAPFNWRMLGFSKSPTDFYTRPYFLAIAKELKPKVAHCIGARPKSRMWLDYFRDVFLMYPQQRKFLFHFLTDLSHDNNNLMTAMDADIKNLVKFLYDGNYLNNTLFILMGDHGARYANFRSTYSGKMEERLPYFGFLFPPWFEQKYPQAIKNLRTNTQRLTTPFDLYETFKDFLHFEGTGVGDVNKRGISLFKEIPLSRTCKDADIAPHWCACLDWKDISAEDPQVKQALKAAIDTINSYTAPYRQDCVLLSLDNVTMSSKLEAGTAFLKFKSTDDEGGIYKINMSNNNRNEMILFQLTFFTSPGGGNFEVSITYNVNTKKFIVNEKEISRINKYGDDPACIFEKNKQIRAYCYCKSNLKRL